ncbi:unnamed protein product (mitochondrion) [Plasmodiophora brassicae]|uniref:DUF4470 domain-containing protein n=1 Tax=Plasmodiophora brassicae TaxID=37360 RepID=A0A0G4IPI9_PLABS|nr:hypothetical protein PBRA_005688 [Plasmodiophora brassicae]SPR01060.1 unnamed protein product [Plasmodiophora brassicae]
MSGQAAVGGLPSGSQPGGSDVPADDLKAQGNASYREKRFSDAVRAYRAAIDLSPDNAVYRSNLAACYFEMGRYDDCIDESRRVLDLTQQATASQPESGTKLTDLRAKNRLRVAKALYFNGKFNECVAELSPLVASPTATNRDVRDLYSSAIELARHLADGPHVDDHRRLLNRFPRYRPPRITNVYEFYPVGHDEATSAMSGAFSDGTSVGGDDPNGLRLRQSVPPSEDTRSAMWLSKMDAQQLGDLSFFFGGVGDARHVFTTLMDVQRQMKAMTRDGEWPASDHPIWSELRVGVVLNDIAIPVLARNLIILYALWELGAFTIEQAQSLLDAVELAALIHFVYLSVTMPPYLHDRLMTVIDRLMSLTSSPQEVLPFVRMSTECWNEVKETLRFWRADPFVVSTEDMAHSFTPMAAVGDLMSVPDKMNAFVEQHKRTLVDRFEPILSPDMLAKFGTIVEKDSFVKQIAASLAATPGAALAGCIPESTFISLTKGLWPPAVLAEQDHVIGDVIAAMKDHRPGQMKELLENVRQHIYRSWKPNVTLVSREWNEHAGRCMFDHDPITIVANLFNVVWMKSPKNPESLFEWSAHFFATVASSVRQLGTHNCLVYEILPGDMNQAFGMVATESESRRSKGLPVAFDRIFLSNVPDYAGLLPVFIDTAPLLKRTPNSYINCGVMVASCMFHEYGEYACSATAIPSLRDCERYLGVALQSGSLMGFDPRWGHAGGKPLLPYDLDDLATQEDLFEWIVRLVLMIAVPPKRDSGMAVREHYPLNLSYVFRTFERLIAIGYPRHWIASNLTRLLENRVVTDTQPLSCSTNRKNGKPARIAMDCFQMELRALAALWQPVLRLAVKHPLPALADIRRFVLRDVQYIDSPKRSGGCPTASIMGVLFEPPSSSQRSSSSIASRRMFVVEPIARELLTSASSRVHVVSALQFDSDANEFAVWLSRDDLAEMKAHRYTVRLFQTDCWTAVSSPQPVADMVESAPF